MSASATIHTSEVTPDAIMQIAFGFAASKTLFSAVELGLFTALGGGPSSTAEIQERLGLHPRAVTDFLDTLVSLQLLERNDGLYSNTPASAAFLDRNQEGYLGGMLEMANRRLYPFWGALTEALRTGEHQNEARHGENFFADIYRDPDRLRGFLEAMTALSTSAAAAIARQFPWAHYQTVADIGTAQGRVPVQLAAAHPHLRAIGFDLPAVQPIFEEYVAAQGLSERVRFQPGDFHSEALPHADVLVMGHILHDWGLADKLRLLRKAYDALPEGGALIVYESLIDDERRANTAGLLMSLNMLIETPAGFDFTGAECRQWMLDTGFRSVLVEPLTASDSMVVAIK